MEIHGSASYASRGLDPHFEPYEEADYVSHGIFYITIHTSSGGQGYKDPDTFSDLRDMENGQHQSWKGG